VCERPQISGSENENNAEKRSQAIEQKKKASSRRYIYMEVFFYVVESAVPRSQAIMIKLAGCPAPL
jgi:hypothetical protein